MEGSVLGLSMVSVVMNHLLLGLFLIQFQLYGVGDTPRIVTTPAGWCVSQPALIQEFLDGRIVHRALGWRGWIGFLDFHVQFTFQLLVQVQERVRWGPSLPSPQAH